VALEAAHSSKLPQQCIMLGRLSESCVPELPHDDSLAAHGVAQQQAVLCVGSHANPLE
jgi:hypothetical protein